jgi:hypothetical protein
MLEIYVMESDGGIAIYRSKAFSHTQKRQGAEYPRSMANLIL